eukprot:8989188-Pyramimonas_sp.AAC.1
MREPGQYCDIRAAGDGRVRHCGEKSVQCDLLDISDVRGVGIDCQVADVSCPAMGVVEACDNGRSA